MHICGLLAPDILKLFLTVAEKKFLWFGIRNYILRWYHDFLTRWENLHHEN